MYKILCSDGTVLYDQSDVNTTRVTTEPECMREIGQNSSTLSFSMLPDHPAYDLIRSMETYISAEEDNDEIFYGRVTEIRTEKTTGVKQVSCTGAMSFLDDFELAPIPNGEQNMTAADFFRRCINGYGTELGNDSKRALGVGTINHTKSTVRREFGMTSYTKVKSALDTYIIKEFGGYLRIRKDGNTHVVDWLESYGTSNASPIELANNVITHENAITTNDFFTVIHPLGKDGMSLPEVTINVDNDLVDTYGRIIKTVSFNNAKTAEELRSEVTEYKTKMAKGLGKTCNVKLIDVHFLDNTVSRIQLGAVYTNIAGFLGEEMTVFSMEQHFDNPSEDKVVLKNHRELSAVKNGSSTGKISKIISSAFENIHKHITETAEMLSIHADLIELHGISIQETAQEFARYSRATDSTIGDILGTGVLQNSDHITQVAGNFTSKYGGVTNARLADLTQKGISPAAAGFYELEAIEITEDMIGSGIEVFGSPNGALNGQALDTSALTVGQIVYRAKFTTDSSVTPGKTYYVKTISVGKGTEVRISEDGQEINVYDSIDNVQEGLLTVTGSSFWTQRDNITGVVGQFQIEEDPETHVRRLVVVSGGGMKILRDNVEYGLYDNGNLTGGIIVEKINDVGTVTKISGDKVVVGSGQTQQVLTTALDNITDFVGEFDVVEDPNTGVKTIVLRSGGGMKVSRNNVEYGIFDNGNLTGGVVVDKINGQGGSGTLTQIRGEFVDITADQVRIGSTSNVQAWMTSTGQDISDLEGLVADRATIAQLNAQKARIDTIETDYITASWLSSHDISTRRVTASNVVTNVASVENVFSAGRVNTDALFVGGNNIGNPIVSASVGGTGNNTLTLTHADGTSVTFSKAPTVQLSESWSNNWTTYTVTAVDSGGNPIAGITPRSITISEEDGKNSDTIKSELESNANHRTSLNIVAGGESVLSYSINASGVYSQGQTAGYGSAKLSGSWTDEGVWTVTKGDTGTDTVSLTLSARAAISYDETTHKYTALGYARAMQFNRATSDPVESGTEAYDAGVTAGANGVTLSVRGWQGGSNRVTASNGKYADITLPSFTTSGGTSFTDHVTTVHFMTASVTGPVKSVDVDATSEYNAGVTAGNTAGYNSAKLAGAWDGSKWTVTKGTTGTDSVSLTLSATAAISYDSTTHKYTATGYARAGNANRATSDPVVSGTQAYDAGVAAVTLSAGGWQGGANRVSASNGEYVDVTLPSFSTSGGTSFSSHKTTVYFTTASVTGNLASKEVDATSEYNAGVTAGNTAGYNSAKLSGSFSGAVWTVTKGTTGTDSVSLTLSATASLSYDSTTHKYTATGKARASNADRASATATSGTEAYDAGYNAGWAAAAAKFKRTGNTVYGPSAAAGGSDRSYTANYSASSCTASKYSASTFQQAKYTAETYTASSYTAEVYSESSYSAEYHYYKAPTYTPSSATSLGGGMYSNYVASKYSAPVHYYTASSYTASSLTPSSYTASSIKASTYTAATYSASTYTKEVYSASAFSWS